MIKTTAIRLLLLLTLFGVWISLHYMFDKKDAEGLMIYAALTLALLGIQVEEVFLLSEWRRNNSKVVPCVT
jgi:hypothetical protein